MMAFEVKKIVLTASGSCLGFLLALSLVMMVLSVESEISSVKYWIVHGVVVALVATIATACLQTLQQEVKNEEEKINTLSQNEPTPTEQIDDENLLPFGENNPNDPKLPFSSEPWSTFSSAEIDNSQYHLPNDLAGTFELPSGTVEQQSTRKKPPKQRNLEQVPKKKKKNKRSKVSFLPVLSGSQLPNSQLGR